MSIFQKITNLFAKKQKIEKEIATLQKSCNHRKKSVRQIRERVDSSAIVIRYVCSECFLPMGYPSKKEIQDFLKK